jgi:hypothetical protein
MMSRLDREGAMDKKGVKKEGKTDARNKENGTIASSIEPDWSPDSKPSRKTKTDIRQSVLSSEADGCSSRAHAMISA